MSIDLPKEQNINVDYFNDNLDHNLTSFNYRSSNTTGLSHFLDRNSDTSTTISTKGISNTTAISRLITFRSDSNITDHICQCESVAAGYPNPHISDETFDWFWCQYCSGAKRRTRIHDRISVATTYGNVDDQVLVITVIDYRKRNLVARSDSSQPSWLSQYKKTADFPDSHCKLKRTSTVNDSPTITKHIQLPLLARKRKPNDYCLESQTLAAEDAIVPNTSLQRYFQMLPDTSNTMPNSKSTKSINSSSPSDSKEWIESVRSFTKDLEEYLEKSSPISARLESKDRQACKSCVNEELFHSEKCSRVTKQTDKTDSSVGNSFSTKIHRIMSSDYINPNCDLSIPSPTPRYTGITSSPFSKSFVTAKLDDQFDEVFDQISTKSLDSDDSSTLVHTQVTADSCSKTLTPSGSLASFDWDGQSEKRQTIPYEPTSSTQLMLAHTHTNLGSEIYRKQEDERDVHKIDWTKQIDQSNSVEAKNKHTTLFEKKNNTNITLQKKQSADQTGSAEQNKSLAHNLEHQKFLQTLSDVSHKDSFTKSQQAKIDDYEPDSFSSPYREGLVTLTTRHNVTNPINSVSKDSLEYKYSNTYPTVQSEKPNSTFSTSNKRESRQYQAESETQSRLQRSAITSDIVLQRRNQIQANKFPHDNVNPFDFSSTQQKKNMEDTHSYRSLIKGVKRTNSMQLSWREYSNLASEGRVGLSNMTYATSDPAFSQQPYSSSDANLKSTFPPQQSSLGSRRHTLKAEYYAPPILFPEIIMDHVVSSPVKSKVESKQNSPHNQPSHNAFYSSNSTNQRHKVITPNRSLYSSTASPNYTYTSLFHQQPVVTNTSRVGLSKYSSLPSNSATTELYTMQPNVTQKLSSDSGCHINDSSCNDLHLSLRENSPAPSWTIQQGHNNTYRHTQQYFTSDPPIYDSLTSSYPESAYSFQNTPTLSSSTTRTDLQPYATNSNSKSLALSSHTPDDDLIRPGITAWRLKRDLQDSKERRSSTRKKLPLPLLPSDSLSDFERMYDSLELDSEEIMDWADRRETYSRYKDLTNRYKEIDEPSRVSWSPDVVVSNQRSTNKRVPSMTQNSNIDKDDASRRRFVEVHASKTVSMPRVCKPAWQTDNAPVLTNSSNLRWENASQSASSDGGLTRWKQSSYDSESGDDLYRRSVGRPSSKKQTGLEDFSIYVSGGILASKTLKSKSDSCDSDDHMTRGSSLLQSTIEANDMACRQLLRDDQNAAAGRPPPNFIGPPRKKDTFKEDKQNWWPYVRPKVLRDLEQRKSAPDAADSTSTQSKEDSEDGPKVFSF